MSKKESMASITRAKPREGEGVSLPITKRLVPHPNGTTAVEISLNLTSAPVPDRRYLADVAAVMFDGQMVRLMFGQKRVTSGLRSLVIVSLSPESARHILKTCESFLPSLLSLLKNNNIPHTDLTSIAEEPAQTVLLAANLMAAAQAGTETCLDFYHMSPFVVRSLSTDESRNNISVDPVLRVDIATSLAASVLTAVSDIQSQLPPELT